MKVKMEQWKREQAETEAYIAELRSRGLAQDPRRR
jgi:hypothetical protein